MDEEDLSNVIRSTDEGTSLRILAEELRSELGRLDRIADALEQGLGEFHHELRRVVRADGRSIALDRKARQLQENIELGRKDLESNRAQRQELAARLCAIEKEIGRKE